MREVFKEVGWGLRAIQMEHAGIIVSYDETRLLWKESWRSIVIDMIPMEQSS